MFQFKESTLNESPSESTTPVVVVGTSPSKTPIHPLLFTVTKDTKDNPSSNLSSSDLTSETDSAFVKRRTSLLGRSSSRPSSGVSTSSLGAVSALDVTLPEEDGPHTHKRLEELVLLAQQEKAFSDVISFYNDLTGSNISYSSSLKFMFPLGNIRVETSTGRPHLKIDEAIAKLEDLDQRRRIRDQKTQKKLQKTLDKKFRCLIL